MKYQVLSRKYRPQRFSDVIGQESLVATLKNAIKMSRVAHAYLFCGTRGTGKTTLARLFSKALNCKNLNEDTEPCNSCCSCLEIMQGASLDFLEIDGASNRGIDDIRQLNETVGYAPSTSASYKIYLIDEVHMLTKEAFNALLKTLEEPPKNVVFFFATTEPHKVPATILSRCQRFNLQRLSEELIQKKLMTIATDQKVTVELEALRKVSKAADGSLRDAESLFDQLLAYSDQEVKESHVVEMLGLMPNESFFALDEAICQNNQAFAFELSHQVVSCGKDIVHFIENLIEHYRYLLLIQLAGPKGPHVMHLDPNFVQNLDQMAKNFTRDQCIALIDTLVLAQQDMKVVKQTSLEALLLRLISSHKKLSIEVLVEKLLELEKRLLETPTNDTPYRAKKPEVLLNTTLNEATQTIADVVENRPIVKQTAAQDPTPMPPTLPPPPPPPVSIPKPTVKPITKTTKGSAVKKSADTQAANHHPSHYDTLMRFAAVELEGTVKNPKNR
ncbi:MAG: DNA polymerase III subunit gamma/tau [Parachlamydiales bacterium]|nr:DNA polymerase III subunit gamma/tau [Parachlamydiales bacterium]